MMKDYSNILETHFIESKLRKKFERNQDQSFLDSNLTAEEVQSANMDFFDTFANGYQLYLSSVKKKSSPTEGCSLEKNHFFLFFGAFVNLYLLSGMHLAYPQKITENDEFGNLQKENASIHLAQNKLFFLEELSRQVPDKILFKELEALFHGIYSQDIKKFYEIQKTNPCSLVSHYIFHSNVALYFQELQKQVVAEGKEFQESSYKLKKIQDQLSLSYAQYQKEDYLPLEYNESSQKIFLCFAFPIPYFRYNVAAIQTLSKTINVLFLLKNLVKRMNNNNPGKPVNEAFSPEYLEENINDLYDLQEDKEVGTWKFINNNLQFSVDSLERKEREQFLKLPYCVDMKKSAFMLLLDSFLTQYQLEEQKNLLEGQKNLLEEQKNLLEGQKNLLEEQKNLLEQDKDRREKLFEEQSHNWKHSAYPHIAFQVAKSLQSRGEEEDLFLSQKLNFVYVANNQLLNNINLLRMEYGTSAENFLPIFREGVFKVAVYEDENGDKYRQGERMDPDGKLKIEKNPVYIREILTHAFQLLAYRLFLPESDPSVNAIEMRDRVINTTELSHLSQSFYDKFLVTNRSEFKMIPWFSKEGYEITRSYSPLWEELVFSKKKPCYTVLMDFLMNLLLNAVNYGAKSKDGHLSIAFSQEEKEGVAYLCIVFENKLDQSPSIEVSEGKGLQGIENRLQRMNLQKKMPRYVLTSCPAENMFRTELWMELNGFWVEKENQE